VSEIRQRPSEAPEFPTYVVGPVPETRGGTVTRTQAYVPAETLNRRASNIAQQQATVGGTNTLLPVVYGTQRVGGRIFAIKLKSNGNLVVGVAWCHGEVDSVVSTTINDEALDRGVLVTHYRGTSGQTYSTRLSAVISGYDDDLPGICYSVYDIPEEDGAGFPRFNAVIKGQKISSSSGGAKAYSQNPAYVIADFIENTTYGMGRSVDWATVATVASACSATVGSPGEAKRLLNLVIDQSLPGEEWLQVLRDYAGCWVVPEGASYRLVADTTGSSVYSFTTANIVEGSLRLTKRGTSETPTMVEVVYTDAGVTPYREARYSTAPVTPRRVSRINKPGITRYSEAVRYATERLNAATLCDLSATFDTFDDGLKLQVGDLVDITHPIGLSAKVMRVSRVDPVSPGRWRIAAVEYDAAVYSSTVATGPTTPDTEVTAWHVFGTPVLVNLTATTGEPNNTTYYDNTSGDGASLTTDAWDLGALYAGDWTVRHTVTDNTGTSTIYVLLSDDGVTYTEHVGTVVRASARYAKVKISTAGDMTIAGMPRLKLDIVNRSESGSVTTAASGATTVACSTSFTQATAVVATPLNSTAARSTSVNLIESSAGGGMGGGWCLRFAGSTDYVNVPDSSSLDIGTVSAGISLEAMIKRSGAGGSAAETIIKKGNNYVLRLHTNGTLRGYIWASPSTRYDITSTYAVPTDIWCRVSLTFAITPAVEAQFFINGEMVETSYTTTSQAQTLTGALTIGGDGSGTTESFNGCIDDVRVWAELRSSTDVRDYAFVALAGTETNLRAYWKCEDATGTNLNDSTSNNNDGTLTNSPKWRPYDGFDVYLFNSSGTQIAGDVSWVYEGY